MRQTLLRAVAAIAPSIAGIASAADPLYVVVNVSNPLSSLTRRDVTALYTGRTRSFPNDQPAQPLDFPRDTELRREFYWALMRQDLAMIDSYWARLLFSGQTQPPRSVLDETSMIAALRANPAAIGYLRHRPTDSSLRVLLTLPADADPK